MTSLRLARRLGVDGNPLRRRTDKIATGLAALLAAMFLIGAPWLSVAAISWAGSTGAAQQQDAHSRHQVPAVAHRAAPVPATAELLDRSWVRARWPAPYRQAQARETVASGSLAAHRAAPLRIDAAPGPAGPPSHAPSVLARETATAVTATVALGTVLLCLAWAGRWMLDRRRLASWEAAWAAIGPQWTKRFRSRG